MYTYCNTSNSCAYKLNYIHYCTCMYGYPIHTYIHAHSKACHAYLTVSKSLSFVESYDCVLQALQVLLSNPWPVIYLGGITTGLCNYLQVPRETMRAACTHIYTYIHVHTYMYIHILITTEYYVCSLRNPLHRVSCFFICLVYIHTYIHTYIHVLYVIHTFIHSYIHTCTHLSLFTSISLSISNYLCIYFFTLYLHTYIHTYIPLLNKYIVTHTIDDRPTKYLCGKGRDYLLNGPGVWRDILAGVSERAARPAGISRRWVDSDCYIHQQYIQ